MSDSGADRGHEQRDGVEQIMALHQFINSVALGFRNRQGFAKINAPAIAYPFLRAYIANFFISSGYNALMLPTINFQAMAEKEREKANDG